MAEVTEREREIIEQVRSGASTPSQLAWKLGISQPGASQALQKLATKGRLTKRKDGRSVKYEITDENTREDRYFLFQAYNALSQVWAYIMSAELSRNELSRARQARETLEKVLARRNSAKKQRT
jgi:predicted ArsR family transcriptional regulator